MANVGILPTDFFQSLSLNIDHPPAFLRLPHPRTGLPSLFLGLQQRVAAAPEILEIQAVAPPNSRSWIVGDNVVADGKLLAMTPFDPAFLLLHLLQLVAPEDGNPGTFRPADDVFEEIVLKTEQASQTGNVLSLKKDITTFLSMDCTRRALSRVCESKEITPDLTVYRYSRENTLLYLRRKVERLSRCEKFEISRTMVRGVAKDGLMEDGREPLLEAARLRSCCDLISQYLSETMKSMLMESYEFSALDSYLRTLEEEVNGPLHVPVKVTKQETSKESDKKRKAGKASQGVEKLKKANVNGMAKLSTFFVKKP